MKKRWFLCGICIVMVMGFAGCGSSMSYDDYDLNEYIKVGEYKGLETEAVTVTVTDDEIQQSIQSALKAAATSESLEKGDAVQDGDTVNIDYTGKIDGKEFDNGSAEGYDLTIGSGSFIDGFEDGLIGKKIGETVALELTFPDDYNEESLQGKDVVFDVTINSATRETIPEYDLDFVKNNTDYDTIEAYEASVKKQLKEGKEEEAQEEQKTALWSKALENTEVEKYPEREVEHYMEFNSQQIDEMAESYGMERAEVLSKYEFGDEEEFAAVNEDSSKLRVKQEMLIEYISDQEGLQYTDEEKQALIEDFQNQGYDAKTIESQTGRTMADYVHIELLYQKVLDFLLENAEIKQ